MNAAWRLVRRLTITVVGLVVVLVGAVLLVAPGPGFLVIALGLLILSIEYEWARRSFARAKLKARTLADQAAANRVSTTLSVIFALGVVGLGGVLTFSNVLPGSGIATGVSMGFGGAVILATVWYSLSQRGQALRARVAADGPRAHANLRADADVRADADMSREPSRRPPR